MPAVDVLIPTLGRPAALAITLAGLFGQTERDFDVVIADQTPDPTASTGAAEVRTVLDAMRWQGHRVEVHHRPERHGIAEQRDFLLSRARASCAHFVDDDVLLEPPVMARMLGTLRAEGCGFVGCAAAGLPFLDDVRPDEQHIEVWDGPVRPEPFAPDRVPWHRHVVNRAANPLHLERRLAADGQVVRYKVAWIGGANVMYDRAKLLDVGGFSFWRDLPPEHAGEDALAQQLLLRTYGGCGILPCGTYHVLLPTNVPDRRRNATELLGRRVAELDSSRLS